MLWLLDGRAHTEISTSRGCSRETINHAKHILTTKNLTVDQIHDLNTSQLEDLFPDHRRRDPTRFLQTDMEAIAQRRIRRKRVIRKVEWERYLTQPTPPGAEHYSFPQYCSLYSRHLTLLGIASLTFFSERIHCIAISCCALLPDQFWRCRKYNQS